MAHDILTVGRIGVDIYPQDVGVDLEDAVNFRKYLGGSPSNVAVAAARHGHTAAVITGVGDDPFGRYLRKQLRSFRVEDRYVFTNTAWPTPVTFCAIQPPDNFPLYFYRTPTAPDLQLLPEHLPEAAISDARIFWFTVTGLSQSPSRESHALALRKRSREVLRAGQFTVIDLDYRPIFWSSQDEARQAIAEVLPCVSVAIGNEQECAVACGEGTADEQADRLLEAGVKIAVVKRGAEGVLAKTAEERVWSAPFPVQTLNGLGAGDAFGGAFCHGLLAGWSLERMVDFANAAGALVASRLSCSDAMPNTDETFALIAEHDRSAS